MATDSATGLPFGDSGSPISIVEHTYVHIDRAVGLPAVTGRVELLFLSQDGVNLLAPTGIRIEEAVVLRILVPGLERELVLPASVRWKQPASADTWRLGCTFLEELPEDILSELSRLGHIERRKDRRRAVDVPAQVRWEYAKDIFPAQIISLSPGGLCVRCCHKGKIGERLLVQLDGGDSGLALIHVRSVWQRAAGEGFLIGCAFASRADYELVSTAMQSGVASMPSKRSYWRPAAILGLAAVVVLLAVVLTVSLAAR
jgi:hypothetical protein